jgi:hypothetical protein
MLLNIAFCVEPVDLGGPEKSFFFSARGCLRVRGEPKKEAAGTALWRSCDNKIRIHIEHRSKVIHFPKTPKPQKYENFLFKI